MNIEIGEVEGGFFTNVIVAESVVWAETELGGTWVDLTGMPGVGIGWGWDGSTATPPPEPAPVVDFTISAVEWVERWTDAEWRSLKNLRNADTTNGERLDRLMDAIQIAGAVDLQGPRMVQFYSFIVARGWITQARADELTAGEVR